MPKPTNPNRDSLRYAGLGMQMLVSLALALFAGYHADRWLKLSTPILVWVLPLVILAGIMYKLIKDTGKKTKDDTTQQVP